MGNLTYVFERVERKFLLTPSQYEGLMRVLPEYMQADQYGESTILSLYLDTADSLLIRRSLEKPVYKEKLRLRSYGVPGDGDNVFLEMKKKVQGVVYKRRICLPLARAMDCLAQESIPAAGWQITEQTFDLHHSPMASGNVMTEYEEKFSSVGNPICKYIIYR